MRYTSSLFLIALLPALAVIMVFCPSTFARQRITADGALERLGLDMEEEALVGYLAYGLPPDSQPERSERWKAYRWVAVKLGELKSERAIFLLQDRIRAPLRSIMERDLYERIARESPYSRSWEDWDLKFRAELADFRGQCALALARIGDEASLPILTAYLTSLEPDVVGGLATHQNDPSRRVRVSSGLAFDFSIVCRAITALGGKEGIDALVGAVDGVLTSRAPEQIVQNLRLCTGQTFGPEYSQPLGMRQVEIQKWKQWWEQNRDTFQADRERILNTHSLDIRTPAPKTVYEYVKAAETRGFDFDGTGHGRASVQWLEANGEAHVEEFEAIINDEEEDTAVRGEALKWYVRFNTAGAFDLLRDYAEDDARYTDFDGGSHYLQSASLEAIREHFPEKAQEVARKCVLSRHESAVASAIRTLMAEPAGQAYLAENYAKLGPLEARLSAVSKLGKLAEPIGRPAFFEAIKSKDEVTAILAAEAIKKFDLETELPPDSRQALERWRRDPQFLLQTIDRSKPAVVQIAQIQEALGLIRTADADAAWAYSLVLRRLLSDVKNTVHEGFDDSILNFKKWQAESGPR